MGADISVTNAVGGAEEFAAHRGTDRILECYALCTVDEIANGLTWYRNANRFARKVASLTAKRPETVAAILARISPQIAWQDNKIAALQIASGAASGYGYPDNIARAERIAEADSEAVIAREVLPTAKYARPKISAFYRNIAYPETVGPITVDTWAARIWLGDVDRTDLKVSAPESKRIQRDYAEAAHIASVLPQNLQAIVWLGAHRLKRAKGQIGLYDRLPAFKV